MVVPGEGTTSDESVSVQQSADTSQLSNKNAILVCDRLLQQVPTSVSRLGGSSRTVWRANLPNDKTVIVAYRKNLNRAELEKAVLGRLSAAAAPVPQLYAARGHWIIQSDLGVARVPTLLDQGTLEQRRNHIIAAIEGLLQTQMAAEGTDLHKIVAPIGRRQGWHNNLVQAPNRIAALAHLPAPKLNERALGDVITSARSRFIKWDARPGNAILESSGRVSWFDFEHSGCRDPIDDLAWFLGDEYLPDDAEFESALIDQFIGLFANELSEKEARRYLTVFGTLHMTVRLRLILKRKKDGTWWSRRSCLENDTVGVTAEQFSDLAIRAARWAEQDSLTSSLVPWFYELIARVVGENALDVSIMQAMRVASRTVTISQTGLPNRMAG